MMFSPLVAIQIVSGILHAVHLSVRISMTFWIESKQLNISSNIFCYPMASLL